MDHLSTATTAGSITSSAISHLSSLALVSTTLSTKGWSAVCPNHASRFSLEEIFLARVDMRTIDYIFPTTQSTPNPEPKTWIINILTNAPLWPHPYEVTALLFTHAGLPEESRIVFKGIAHLLIGDSGSMTLSGNCKVVENTGTGIFEGVTEGRANFKNDWGKEVTMSSPPGPDFSNPGLRIRPVNWSFLLSKDIAGALNLALSQERTPSRGRV